MIHKIIKFLKTDIWRIRSRKLPARHSFFLRQLRVILLAVRGFAENDCSLKASALTFYSLLSIVPVVAMAFGIAKGFGFQNMLEQQLMGRFPGQEEVLTQIFTFANSMLENTKGGIVAGIGVIVLFWAVIKVLGQIERSFNHIWGVKQGRGIARKFSDYLSIMLICPLLLIVSSSATVFIATQVKLIMEKIAILGVFSPIISMLLKLLPYTLLWLLFTFIYMFIPNTKVKFSSAVFAGVIAGTIYQLVQVVYIIFQVGVTKYNAIYGSFAALPLFLVWLQLSWRIVLFGAEISFAHDNVDTYEFEPDCLRVSYSFKRLLTLEIVHLIIKNFLQEKKCLDDNEISDILDIPIRLVREIIFELEEAGIIVQTQVHEKYFRFQPAHDPCVISIKFVMEALEKKGIDDIPVAHTKELERLSESLEKIRQAFESSAGNKLLKDI